MISVFPHKLCLQCLCDKAREPKSEVICGTRHRVRQVSLVSEGRKTLLRSGYGGLTCIHRQHGSKESFPGSGYGLLADFADPPISARPKLRWWWPHGLVDAEEIKAEIDEMGQGGFGGAEINDVHHSIHVALDPEGQGRATGPWIDAVRAASDHAKSLGFQIDVAPRAILPRQRPYAQPGRSGREKEVVTGRVMSRTDRRTTGRYRHHTRQRAWA